MLCQVNRVVVHSTQLVKVPTAPLSMLAVIYNTQLLLHCCCARVLAETVIVEDGTSRLLLTDKFGDVHEALLLENGSYHLNPRPLAQLGPGRVLGNKLDANGNLVMCDVLKVQFQELLKVTPMMAWSVACWCRLSFRRCSDPGVWMCAVSTV